VACFIASSALAQPADAPVRPHAGMLRYPDVSQSQIVFTYAGDLWLAPIGGGTATPLASPPGQESFPKFSPDGKSIAFVGNYDGGRDLYIVPAAGGLPTRVTHHPSTSDDISGDRSKLRNFTQIFERAIQITQTRKGMDMEVVMNELQLQIKYRTMEIKRELDLSVINGKAYYDGSYVTGDYAYRTMNGIVAMLRDPDMDNTNEDTLVTQISGALTVGNINTLLYNIWNAGGLDEMSDPIIAVGASQQRVIAAFEKDIRRVEQGERQVGYYRDIFLSDMGTELPIVLDRWIPQDKLIVLDRSRVSLKPLQGDAWHLEKMAKTGRSEKWQLSGQYGLELRNPGKCHGMLYDLT
jgi:dipeptidyl aminopeptidase/acylaminoacyl peptidase